MEDMPICLFEPEFEQRLKVDCYDMKLSIDSILQNIHYLDTCSVGKTKDFDNALTLMSKNAQSVLALLKKYS